MNGSNGATDAREEAKSALKALLASAKNAQASGGYPVSGVSEEEAGTALRSRFRSAVTVVLREPAAAARLQDLEAQVSQLLDRPPPPSQASAEAAEPSAQAGAPPPAEEQGPSLLELAEQSLPPPPPPGQEQPLPRQPRRRLIQEQVEAEHLRNAVAEARRRLFSLDKEVTGLTRELKNGRGKLWTLQQDHSEAEKRISSFLASRSSELSSDALEEERALKQEQQSLRHLLRDARDKACRWYAEAKQQDSILEPEREAQKGGAQWRMLCNHPILRPVGEIFLATYPEDNDSDDGYPYEGGRPPSRAQQHQRRNSDTSDDDDEDGRQYYPRPQAGHDASRLPMSRDFEPGQQDDADKDGRGPPPPAGKQQYRMTRGVGEMDDDSDGSSMPSPSGESGSMSAMLERSDEAAINAMQPPSTAAGTARPTITQAASSSGSDDSEDEALARNKKPSGQSGGGPVPSLPLASAGLTAGRSAAVGVGGAGAGAKTSVDEPEEVEEYSSDDIEEEVEDMETSRSC